MSIRFFSIEKEGVCTIHHTRFINLVLRSTTSFCYSIELDKKLKRIIEQLASQRYFACVRKNVPYPSSLKAKKVQTLCSKSEVE
jgi:hypothetical protein